MTSARPTSTPSFLDDAARAIVLVGDGRGFRVRGPHERGWRACIGGLVVTAAHCLPDALPPPNLASCYEREYESLVSDRDGSSRFTCECLFVDPIGDIAALGKPHDQLAERDDYEAIETFFDDGAALSIGIMDDPRDRVIGLHQEDTEMPVWLLTIEGEWERCSASRYGRIIRIGGSPEATAPGTSGSPVLSETGRAMGVVNGNLRAIISGRESHESAAASVLADCLPGWLLSTLLESDPWLTHGGGCNG